MRTGRSAVGTGKAGRAHEALDRAERHDAAAAGDRAGAQEASARQIARTRSNGPRHHVPDRERDREERGADVNLHREPAGPQPHRVSDAARDGDHDEYGEQHRRRRSRSRPAEPAGREFGVES